MSQEILRSALYMPASNQRAMDKARDLPCDAVIFDLEDAVAPEAKLVARRQVLAQIQAGGYGARKLVVRANGTTLAASRVVDLILPVLQNVEYAEIEGAGHMSPVTHPDRVNPVVEAFLAAQVG